MADTKELREVSTGDIIHVKFVTDDGHEVDLGMCSIQDFGGRFWKFQQEESV